MPRVEVETFVRGPAQAAYALVKDMEAYPRFMKAVTGLRVLHREGDTCLTEWSALFQGKRLRGKERDVFDEARFSMAYRQTEGDLKKFEGEWCCVPQDGGTRITLSVDFDLGIPMLAGLLDPMAKLVVRRNCEAMLEAIRAQVESAGANRPASGGGPWS